MTALDNLVIFDHSLFVVINSIFPHNFLFDFFFIVLSIIGSFGFVWILIAIYLAIHHRKTHSHTTRQLVIANITSLVVVEFVIKNIVRRPRPQFTLPNLHMVLDPLTTYSFPSTHSAFAFASAFILSKAFPRKKIIWYSLATLIAFSRIYLEKHYPLDVVGGAVVGTMIGWTVLKIKNRK